MSDGTKIRLGLLFLFVFIVISKFLNKKEDTIKKEEIIAGGIHIDKKPCVAGMNLLFEKSVDSSSVCECLIPKFYLLIKNDPKLVEEFKKSDGLFKLNGSLQDSSQQLLINCLRQSIIDSTHKFYFSAGIKQQLKEKFQNEFLKQKNIFSLKAEYLSDCIINRLNGRITIADYLAEDYDRVPVIKNAIDECIAEAFK